MGQVIGHQASAEVEPADSALAGHVAGVQPEPTCVIGPQRLGALGGTSPVAGHHLRRANAQHALLAETDGVGFWAQELVEPERRVVERGRHPWVVVANPRPRRERIDINVALRVLPITQLVGNMALSLAAFSYAGRLSLVVTADAERFPDLGALMDGMSRDWGALAGARLRAAGTAGEAHPVDPARVPRRASAFPATAATAIGARR